MSDAPIRLADALRALPLPTPPHAGWPALQRRLHQRRRRRPLLLALAASLLLGITIGLALGRLSPAPADPQPALLATLRAESARLEALLAASGHAWVDTGDSALLDRQLVQRLQWIDLQLAEAEPHAALPLWSERVALLGARAELAQARTLSASGDSAAGQLMFSL